MKNSTRSYLSAWKNIALAGFMALLMVACGDENSSSAPAKDSIEASSSSEELSSSDKAEAVSSSTTKSAASSATSATSSSEKATSSESAMSSESKSESSSSVKEENQSSSSENSADSEGIAKRFGACTDEIAGKVKAYYTTHYTCEAGEWRLSTPIEALGKCTSAKAKQILKGIDSTYYICENDNWRKLTDLENALYKAPCLNYAELGYLENFDKWFVCDASTIREADSIEIFLDRGCTSYNRGDKYITYLCQDNGWYDTIDMDTIDLKKDTDGATCYDDSKLVSGEVSWKKLYVCDANKFRYADSIELYLDLGCTSYNRGTVKPLNDVNYVCDSDGWRKAETELEADTYGITCGKHGRLVNGNVNKDKRYVCDEDQYREANSTELALSLGCTSYNRNEETLYNEVSYKCYDSGWSTLQD